jgi:hypothetical protein
VELNCHGVQEGLWVAHPVSLLLLLLLQLQLSQPEQQ